MAVKPTLRHAPGQIAIGGDESGGLPRPLQALAQQNRDGEGFLYVPRPLQFGVDA